HAYRSGAEKLPDLLQFILGNINGSFEKLGETVSIGGGVLGEGSAVLLILGGLYLVYKKAAKWRLVVSFLSVYTIVQIILHTLVTELSPPLLYGLFSGGVFLAGFFMVTDPVSAPKTPIAQLIYGSLIAIVGQIIKTFSLFAGGIMFAILFGNMFAPLMDHTVRYFKRDKK
ncbi:MAG: RnfABCDGE type electron transport complex subunit D, partial [bacterium]